MKKTIKNPIFTFIIGAIIFGSIGVLGASYLYHADEVSYTPKNNKFEVDNVEDAINELYQKVNNNGIFKVGDEVYYNPVDDIKCTKQEVEDNIATNGLLELKTGCMKWYIISIENNRITMILDHNTKENIVWNSGVYGTYPYASSPVKSSLDSLVSSSKWLVTPRSITLDDINLIVDLSGCNHVTKYCYFDTASETAATFDQNNRSKFYWLYDNLNGCKSGSTDYGCVNELPGASNAYWTSNYFTRKNNGDTVYLYLSIRKTGSTSPDLQTYSNGARPVITINKAIVS